MSFTQTFIRLRHNLNFMEHKKILCYSKKNYHYEIIFTFIMKNLIRNLFIFSYVFFLMSCLVDPIERIDWKTENYEPGIIVSSHSHLGFPDLIYHNNTWYMSYRQADDHGSYTSKSSVHVLKSKNFIDWTEINSFELPGLDLRSGIFSYNKIENKLYLHLHAAIISDTRDQYGINRKDFYSIFDNTTGSFGNNEELQIIAKHKDFPLDWLWKPVWHDNDLYAVGYSKFRACFYKYTDLHTSPIIFAKIENLKVNETKFTIVEDSLYFLARTNNVPFFGRLGINIKEVKNISMDVNIPLNLEKLPELAPLGGPNMIIKNDIAFIGGRVNDDDGKPRTMLFQYSLKNKELNHIETFISYGDNSYPGLVLQDSLLYGIYYTQNYKFNRYEIRSFKIDLNSL